MTISIIDTHCHFDDELFDKDRDQVMQRALDRGIQQIIIPATTAQRWGKIKQLTQMYAGVFASYGLHPMFMTQHEPHHMTELDSWLDKEEAVAVGECGLDFFQGNSDQQQQLELFRGQLSLAKNHHLPVIIHARKSVDIALREIRKSGVSKGVMHSFSGSQQQAEQIIDLGFKLGISATVSFDRAKKLRSIIATIDVNGLVIESDAPDQPGEKHRVDRNEPSYISDHLAVMAELRGMSVEQLGQKLTQNSKYLFSLSG